MAGWGPAGFLRALPGPVHVVSRRTTPRPQQNGELDRYFCPKSDVAGIEYLTAVSSTSRHSLILILLQTLRTIQLFPAPVFVAGDDRGGDGRPHLFPVVESAALSACSLLG